MGDDNEEKPDTPETPPDDKGDTPNDSPGVADLEAAKARIAELEQSMAAAAPFVEAGRAARVAAARETLGAASVRPEFRDAFEAIVEAGAVKAGIDLATADEAAILALRAKLAKALAPMINSGRASSVPGTGELKPPPHPFSKIPRAF